MNKNDLNYFKNRLIREKQKINEVIEELKPKKSINTNAEMASEISVYDDHTGDSAGALFDMTRDIALENNEKTILNKIDNAINKIDSGDYGKCNLCGKLISQERLSFIPYAENCIECENKVNEEIKVKNNSIETMKNLRNSERPSYYSYKATDSSVYKFNNGYESINGFIDIDGEYDNYYDDNYYVDPIESISNTQYKNQLPY